MGVTNAISRDPTDFRSWTKKDFKGRWPRNIKLLVLAKAELGSMVRYYALKPKASIHPYLLKTFPSLALGTELSKRVPHYPY